MNKDYILKRINEFYEENREEQKLTLLINNVSSVKFRDIAAIVESSNYESMTKAYRIVYDIEIATFENTQHFFKIETYLSLTYERIVTYLSPGFHVYREKSIHHKEANYYLVDNNFALEITKELVFAIEFLNTHIEEFRNLNVEKDVAQYFVSRYV